MNGYRADIDGLRAIAVLSVCFSHAGLFAMPGGFVGVDVFFVISGFLICGILFREVEAGTFSIIRFYERRARRILPALLALLAALMVGGLFLFPPWQYESFGKSAIATILFVSNFWFLKETTGYFGAASEFEPLLHTWSLAVEEQFYIFIPFLFLFLVSRSKALAQGGTLAISVTSFALSVLAVRDYPSQGFYLLHARAWELGAGALLALGFIPAIQRGFSAELISGAGVAAILASCFLLDADSSFPGPNALAPVFGAAAIIFAGSTHQTFVTRILSTRPFVLVGKVSYSLYLWHWPPLVVARTVTGDSGLSTSLGIACLTFAFAAAYLSWRFIERPWRTRPDSGGFQASTVFASSVAGAAVLTIAAGFAVLKDGFVSRVPADTFDRFNAARRVSDLELECRRSNSLGELCTVGAAEAEAEPSVLVWGDSHAAALLPGLDKWLRDSSRSAFAATLSACPPIIGVIRADRAAAQKCTNFNHNVFEFAIRNARIDTIVLIARWALNAEGDRVGRESGTRAVLGFEDGRRGSPADNFEVFHESLTATVLRLTEAGKKIIIVAGIPEIGVDVPQAYLDAMFFTSSVDIAISRADYERRNARVLRVLEELAASPSVDVVRVADAMCASDCLVEVGGKLIYRDDDHLSIAGAKWLMPALLPRSFGANISDWP